MSADFRPTASWQHLRRRAELLRRLRALFDDRGFLEVETPILSADTVVDRHLDPFRTTVDRSMAPQAVHAAREHHSVSHGPGDHATSYDGEPRTLWLQTSPEFAMKRMLAAGARAIYQVARVFRLGEQGPLHNPEFTMVEWYRAGDDMDRGMQLTSDLAEAMLDRGPARRVAYAEAFIEHVGLDPHTCEPEALAAKARQLGVDAPASLCPRDRDGWLDLLLVDRVQPHLGREQPVLLYDYPAGQAALARVRDDDPPVAERFELYVDGIELANGYHELLDAAELRARNERVNAERIADGNPALPDESRLLAAMEAGLPASTGVALGFDRLVMVATGAASLSKVMAFPIDRA